MVNLRRLAITAALAVSWGLLLNPITVYAKISIPHELYEYYSRQPESVKKSFAQDNWDLEIAKGDELNYLYAQGDFYNNGYDVSGVTVYDIKTIYLSDSPGYASKSLNHEMGHYVDYSYYEYYGIQPSMTDEFIYIFEKEAAGSYIYEDYELSSPIEYFAQSYWAYVEAPSDLKAYYPLTYRFIENILNNFDFAVENGYNRVFDGSTLMNNGN